MRILIVEDQKRTADFICKGFREYQFQADAVYDGAEALFQLSEIKYDAVVLDVLLPIMDGWTVLEKIRETKPDLPVIMLSACDDVESRIRGLEAGAHDYLIKPFSFNELLARVKSLLRRKPNDNPIALTIDDLKLDLMKHTAERGGKKLLLTAKEFMLLALMLRRSGEVLSRTIIAEQVWDIHFDCNTNIIDVAIKRLREKVDSDYPRKLIHTVRGVGYVLEIR
ncbi:copper-responsive two-component system response regulator LciR [Legionella bononiensis]|uniref:Heavy metal response regulator transcription factor n=1 Tax=Legionella bononiensis TaxID=2793102 RepID=A0ABS1W763_9GAMM|nr:heavy metal response regulator transcription factor [Legionella bononiensis]MBL7481299.1 heavy metal response regulator transcription factor [Legionella bononiensis]MBL7525203.1 heavy metal response regulator transcription factor [Legionella bononiensis]MBL7561386.1 heavy metal response regulator transcription factor [Legionella bononiensis]